MWVCPHVPCYHRNSDYVTLTVYYGHTVHIFEGPKSGEGVESERGEDEMGEVDQMIDCDHEMGDGNNQERPIETETRERNVLGDVEEESGSTEGEIVVVDNDGDLDEIRDELDPKRNMKGFRVDIVNELRVNVSKDQAYRAKRAALKAIERSSDYQYTRLWDYAEEMRVTNPGSTVIVGTDNENRENRFNRLYVCFGALKVGFKSGCRPITRVYGCHLKGPHGGFLLTAFGIDPNNNLFSIPYVVVDKEYIET
ncbi:UNVERIFIED_CONTAM: hypothetical protein Sradi_3354800 [Sesamum radiatum]|uniref:Transposase n=1 Tax=Sesamum radiatum TaxID=300843 RepID=A0AAW2R2X7_SESRA